MKTLTESHLAIQKYNIYFLAAIMTVNIKVHHHHQVACTYEEENRENAPTDADVGGRPREMFGMEGDVYRRSALGYAKFG